MKFGRALEILKAGGRIARKGWADKNQFIYLHEGNVAHDAPKGSKIRGVSSDLFTRGDSGTTTRMPNINLRTSDGAIATGWAASDTDMFSEDWIEVNETD